ARVPHGSIVLGAKNGADTRRRRIRNFAEEEHRLGPRTGATSRVKLAWFTPFSKISAIGDCSEIILRELVKSADVTVYAADIRELSRVRTPDFDTRLLWGVDPDEIVRDLDQYDCVVYNLGNHYDMHQRTYEVALRSPGVVVLHDLVMHHLFFERYLVSTYD